jgi:hypothetical protein
LHVLNSRISSSSHVARFLSGIFPILVMLVHYSEPMQEGGFTAEDCENWDQVKICLMHTKYAMTCKLLAGIDRLCNSHSSH